MKIQAYLTAAAINLKRLAVALFAILVRWIACWSPSTADRSNRGVDLAAWTEIDPVCRINPLAWRLLQ
jgi:hypothetical protein